MFRSSREEPVDGLGVPRLFGVQRRTGCSQAMPRGMDCSARHILVNWLLVACCLSTLVICGCGQTPASTAEELELSESWWSTELAESPSPPLVVEEIVEEPEPVDPGPPVSNVWVEADLKAVFRDITAQTGVLIIPGAMVEGVVSLETKKMPLEECLKRIAMTGPWGYKKVDNYYVFGSTAPGSKLADLLGETKRVKLNYTTANEVHNLLPHSLSKYVSVGKSANVLAVTAPKPVMNHILRNIAKLDIAPRQVIAEVLVVQLSETARKELGVDWEWQRSKNQAGFDALIGTFTYDAGSDLARRIKLTLKALVTKDQATVLASPRLAALDRQEASIHVGEEKYYTLLGGYTDRPYYTLESIKAGVTLKITPYIGNNGDITMMINPEVSEVQSNWGTNGSNLPVINRRSVKTTVRVKNGQTILIGGLLHKEKNKLHQKVMLLGDVPVLGGLFRSTTDVTVQTEVLIFITPHLMTDSYRARSLQQRKRFQQ